MKKSRTAIGLALQLAMAWLVCGCSGVSSNPVNGEYEKNLRLLCERIIECEDQGGGSVNDCMTLLGGMTFRQGCIAASVIAPCEDHANPDSMYANICWDDCTGSAQFCKGDQIQACTNQNLWVFDCSLKCHYSYHLDYSGVCGKIAPDGITTSELETCWCE